VIVLQEEHESTKPRVIGKCEWCHGDIHEGDDWDMVTCVAAKPGDIRDEINPDYSKKPVHISCKTKIQDMFIKDLLRDVKTLDWLLCGGREQREAEYGRNNTD